MFIPLTINPRLISTPLPDYLHTSTMTRNKQRVLLALYLRPTQPNSPHYALITTPKIKRRHKSRVITGTRWHAHSVMTIVGGQPDITWHKEITYVQNLDEEPNLLVCGVVGKVVNPNLAETILYGTRIIQADDVRKDQARLFDSAQFAKDALWELRHRGAITSINWAKAQGELLAYMRKYRDKGRWSTRFIWHHVPIIDLVTGKELRS